MPPKVSVITPTYNHEGFIGASIESVLAQTFDDWEMIIVDDGSTDGTSKVVRGYCDPRIHLISQENQGLASLGKTYNRALALAQGEVIAILEGDDYWPAYKLQHQVSDFDDPNVVLSTGITAIVDTEGAYLGVVPVKALPEYAIGNQPVGSAVKLMMDPQVLTYTFPVATMIRTSSLREIGGFQQPADLPLVDLPTFMRIALEGEFRFQTHVCGYWRRHTDSATKSRFPQILDGAYHYCLNFAKQHRGRLPFSDAELDALELKWENFEAQRCLLRGRMLAASHDYAKAALAYKETNLYRRSAFTNLAGKASRLLSLCHLPSEWLFRAYGRPNWADVIQLDSGDRLVAATDLDNPRRVYKWRTS